MRSRVVLALSVAAWLGASLVAWAQSGGAAESYYRRAHDLYKRQPPDYVNAAIWYRRAADMGHAAAQNDLGWLYQNGWGVPRDLGQAVYWYRQSANQGFATGQVNLGFMYQKGRGVPVNYVEAVRLYRLAAAQNDSTAADNLGVMYRDGLGVPRDHNQAVSWFRKAAAAGHADGQTDLGWMYHNGWGVPRDYAEAMKWYRQAAAQGDALAQNNLGVLYRDSLGVPRDLDAAFTWFRKAAAGGDPRAQQSLRHLESLDRGMTPWPNILQGKSVRIAITAKGMVYLFGDLTVRLSAASTLDVEIPIKIFTDPELRQLGVLKPDGSISIGENPNLPYKPMRAASPEQRRRFFTDMPATAIAIYWPPYVVVAPGVDKQPPGTKQTLREIVERTYER
jgi:TPR repeat protein